MPSKYPKHHPTGTQVQQLQFHGILQLSFLLLFILFPLLAQSQSSKPFDFSGTTGWNDYRSCVRGCFMPTSGECCQGQVGPKAGCTTNECLCGDKIVFDKAMDWVISCTQSTCEDQSGVNAGKKILLEFCNSLGYVYEDVGDNVFTRSVGNGASTTILGDGTGPTVTMVITNTVTVVADSDDTGSSGARSGRMINGELWLSSWQNIVRGIMVVMGVPMMITVLLDLMY